MWLEQELWRALCWPYFHVNLFYMHNNPEENLCQSAPPDRALNPPSAASTIRHVLSGLQPQRQKSSWFLGCGRWGTVINWFLLLIVFSHDNEPITSIGILMQWFFQESSRSIAALPENVNILPGDTFAFFGERNSYIWQRCLCNYRKFISVPRCRQSNST